MTKKKVIRIALIAAGVILAAAVIYFGIITWMIQTGRLVKWDNHWYTRGQLEEKYGPQYYEAEAKNTPEEVYSEFRQALMGDDIEEALGYIAGPERERYQREFASSTLLEKYKRIPSVDKIELDEQLGNYAHYSYYLDDKELSYGIGFAKGVNGYWWIESI